MNATTAKTINTIDTLLEVSERTFTRENTMKIIDASIKAALFTIGVLVVVGITFGVVAYKGYKALQGWVNTTVENATDRELKSLPPSPVTALIPEFAASLVTVDEDEEYTDYEEGDDDYTLDSEEDQEEYEDWEASTEDILLLVQEYKLPGWNFIKKRDTAIKKLEKAGILWENEIVQKYAEEA
jgi:hypothetical protein